MTDELKQISADFETALLNGVRTGADEAALTRVSDRTVEQLLLVKEAMQAQGQLDEFFTVAIEVKTKLDMAIETIRKVDKQRKASNLR